MPGEKRARNLEIVQLFLDGEGQNEIAKAYKISRKRVEQILAAYFKKHPLDPVVSRAQAMERLEQLVARLLQMSSVQAIRELRQVIYTQAKIAGFVAPTKVQLSQDDTDYEALRKQIFGHLFDPRPAGPHVERGEVASSPPPGPGERLPCEGLPGQN